MEVVIGVDLLLEEQAMFVECFEVDGQLAAKDIVNMFEDTADMADYTVDMVEDIMSMVEDMMGIAEMVSIVVEGNFGVDMAWVHSKNSEHTFDLVQEIENSDLETYLEVEVLAAMVS